MAGAKTLRINIVGDSSSAERSLTKVATNVGQTSSTMGRMGSTLGGVGSALTGIASRVTSFANSGVDALKDITSQSVSLQKVMGGSIEAASRLRYAASVLGVDASALSKGMGFLSKNIAGNTGAWKSLGINARDAHGNMRPMEELLPEILDKISKMPPGIQRTALMQQLFGKGWRDLTPLLGQSGDQLKKLEGESDQLGLTLDGKTTKSVRQQAIEQRKMQEAFKAVKVQVGTALMPALTQLAGIFTTVIAPVIRSVTGFMREHATVVKILAGAFIALIAAVKTVNAITSAVGAIRAVVGAIQAVRNAHLLANIAQKAYAAMSVVIRGLTLAWAAAQWVLNAAMSANPIGLIIIAIVALVAVFVVLWNKCAWFRDFWKAIWNGIKAVAVAIWNFLKDHWKTILLVMMTIMTGGLAFIITHWRQVWGAVKAVFSAIWNAIKAVALAIWNAIKAAFMFWLNANKAIFTAVWNAIKAVGVAIWNAIKAAFVAVWNAIKAVASAIWNGMKATFTAIWNAAKAVWSAVWNAVKNVFQTIWNTIKGIASAIWNGIKAEFSAIWNGIKSIWESVWNGIKSFFSNIWNGIKGAFTGAVDWIKGKAEGFLNFFKDLPARMGGFLKGLWTGLKHGLVDAINWVSDKINWLLDKLSSAWDWIPGAPDLPHLPHIPDSAADAGLAKGGVVTRAGMTLVGEKGPELLNLPRSASVIPLPRGAAAGGSPVVVNVHVAGHVTTDRDLTLMVRDELVRISRRNGGRGGLTPR